MNMKNSTQYPNDDFFTAMYSCDGLNHFMFTTVVISTIIGLILMSGIIWYERCGNHRCRTAINQLFSTVAVSVISYTILVYIPEGIRYLKGPLNPSFCDFHNFMKNFLPNCFLLTFDCIILLRYLFIFKLSNFAVVNDDLIVRFLNLSIVFVSFWLSLMKRMSPGWSPLNYHLCAGSYPGMKQGYEVIEHSTENFNTTQIVAYFSFILHTIILTKIFLYKRKMEKKQHSSANLNLGNDVSARPNSNSEFSQQPKVAWSTESKRFPSFSQSMIDFTTQLLCLLILVVVAILNSVKNATNADDLNEDKNRWYAYFEQAAFSIIIIGIPLVYYGRKKYIATTIWKRIIDAFRN